MTASPSGFAPALDRAVRAQTQKGVGIDEIESLFVPLAASLRGVHRLSSLKALFVHQGSCLRHLRGHPTLQELSVHGRGRHKPTVDITPLRQVPALRKLQLINLRLRSLGALSACRLESITLSHCDVRPQRFRPPASLVGLDIDGTSGVRLRGVCPDLSEVDLWGTDMEPVAWVAQQPAIELVWLVGCKVPTLEPLLAMPRPPRWILMDGDNLDDLTPHQDTIARLEAKGARFALGSPHDIGIWLPPGPPGWAASEHRQEPLYLSPGWPRSVK